MQKPHSIKEVREYYDTQFFGKMTFPRPFGPYGIMLNHLKLEKDKYLLDVGCGRGELQNQAQQKGVSTFGIDISGVALAMAKTILNPSNVAIADAERLPFRQKSFDYLTCLGSLEHYADPGNALREFRRVIKNDGVLLVTVPNLYHLLDVYRVFRTGFTGRGEDQPFEKRASVGEWKALLKENDFKILRVSQYKEEVDTSWGHIFSDLKLRRVVGCLIVRFLQFIVPVNLAFQLVFVCGIEKGS